VNTLRAADARGCAMLCTVTGERGGFRMRAAWYERGGPASEVLTVGEMEAPRPDPGEVLVRVRTSGVNPGEVKKRSDWMGFGIGYPRVVPHSDGAGTIERVGEGVSPSRVGERVWVWGAQSGRPFGTAAEYTAVPKAQAVTLPDGVGFEAGACLGIPARTAHRCVFADGPVSGKVVLVAGGAGAVGSFAVSFAKWGGAEVVATVGSEAHAEAVLEAGASHALNYRAEDVATRVREITEGSGVDRIVEVALGHNLAVDAEVIAQLGTIAAYSSNADAEPRLPFWDLLFKNVTIRLVGSDDLPEEAEHHAVEDISAALAARVLRPRIARRLPLERIAEAHEAVDSGRAGGRVILDIDGPA
jgi:NADPH:quinone reductase